MVPTRSVLSCTSTQRARPTSVASQQDRGRVQGQAVRVWHLCSPRVRRGGRGARTAARAHEPHAHVLACRGVAHERRGHPPHADVASSERACRRTFQGAAAHVRPASVARPTRPAATHPRPSAPRLTHRPRKRSGSRSFAASAAEPARAAEAEAKARGAGKPTSIDVARCAPACTS